MVEIMFYNFLMDLLDVLYEDGYIVVVNKFLGFLFVSGCGEYLVDCLIFCVQVVFFDVFLVYCLDCDILGVMVFVLMVYVQCNFLVQFEKCSIKKIYIVCVFGEIVEKIGIVDLLFIVDWLNCFLQKVCYEIGKFVVIDWCVMKVGGGEICVWFFFKIGCSY